jgi:hypothetical protein
MCILTRAACHGLRDSRASECASMASIGAAILHVKLVWVLSARYRDRDKYGLLPSSVSRQGARADIV